MRPPRFVSIMSPPPGGFVFETHGERVTGRCFDEIAPKVRGLMAKYGIAGTAEAAVAGYMCPRLGPAAHAFCAGEFSASDDVGRHEAVDNCEPYYSRQVAPFDVIERRLARCMTCPRHFRGWCLTCTGHHQRILNGFRGRRPALPVDRGTGVCTCARAYEAAVASVEYAPEEKIWEGAPETCWRISDV